MTALQEVTPEQLWWMAAAALLLGATTAIYLLLRTPQAFPFWQAYLSGLQRRLDRLAAKISPIRVVHYQLLACGALFCIWLLLGISVAPFLCPAIVPATYLILHAANVSRTNKLATQLDAWLFMLSNMLKTTGSVAHAIRSTVELSKAPLSEELEIVLKHVVVGTSLEDALDIMYSRSPSDGLRTVATSLRIGRRLGGDLPALLAENAASLRESQRVDGYIRTHVAQGKAQLVILAVAPAGFIAMLARVTPGFFTPVTSHAIAPYFYAGCASLWIGAIVIGFAIMRVDA